jgi:hypothetical protein
MSASMAMVHSIPGLARNGAASVTPAATSTTRAL